MISYVKTEWVSKILDPLSGIDLMSDSTARCICTYSVLQPSVESVLHDSQSHETVKYGHETPVDSEPIMTCCWGPAAIYVTQSDMTRVSVSRDGPLGSSE
jgi:hypothetical protein